MPPDIAGIAIERLKDHYKHCIRLSASNKINPKNAFDLQLIDYMQDLVNTNDGGQMNFKIASSALDVGAKIYSNRVDCIQSEAQKVASSILMALDSKDQRGNQNQDDPNDSRDGNISRNSDGLNDSNDLDNDGQKRQKKKNRNHRKSVKTIAEDSTLDGKVEKMVLGDAFLDGLSKDYDMSCPAALICYNALTQPSGLLTVESNNFRKDYRETSESYNGTSGDQAVTLLTKHQTNCAQIIRNSLSLRICPRLDEFLFSDKTTKILGINTSIDESVIIPNERPIVNTTKITGAPHEFDPMMFDDGVAGNDSNDHFMDADSNMGGDHADKHQENLIPNLDRIAASKPTDYGYSEEHHRLLNTWAGPHAWKTLKVPKTVRKDVAPKSTRKRVKLEQKPIDFMEDFNPEKGKCAEKETRHGSDVIKKWKKPFYCQDHNLNEESIREIVTSAFYRPEDTYHCAKTPADAQRIIDKDHDYLGTDENGGGDADAIQNDDDGTRDGYETPMGGFDDVHDDSDDEFRADPVVEGNELGLFGAATNNPLNQEADFEFAGENLIEQPYIVAQLNIPFAKTAKKMDVRRLKRVMWDLLWPQEKRHDTTVINQTVIENPLAAAKDKANPDQTISSDEQPQENGISTNGIAHTTSSENGVIENHQVQPEEETELANASTVHLEFANLYGELPVKISSKMANDLSKPIAFVTLLHLANEKNLRLIPKDDLRDFIIEQDETLTN